MLRAIAATVVFSWAFTCMATGFTDFTRDIGDGYILSRSSDMDIYIGTANGSLITYPGSGNTIGPISHYIVTPDHIFTRNLGLKPKTMPAGNTVNSIDSTQEFFFIISKGSNAVQGPFSKSEFSKRPEVATLGNVDWMAAESAGESIAMHVFGIAFLLLVCLISIRYFIKKRAPKASVT